MEEEGETYKGELTPQDAEAVEQLERRLGVIAAEPVGEHTPTTVEEKGKKGGVGPEGMVGGGPPGLEGGGGNSGGEEGAVAVEGGIGGEEVKEEGENPEGGDGSGAPEGGGGGTSKGKEKAKDFSSAPWDDALFVESSREAASEFGIVRESLWVPSLLKDPSYVSGGGLRGTIKAFSHWDLQDAWAKKRVTYAEVPPDAVLYPHTLYSMREDDVARSRHDVWYAVKGEYRRSTK